MSEEKILSVHNIILDYLLKYKENNNAFTFSPRKNNNANKLDRGYWFQGSENYIFVPLFKRGCSDNKTKTIGFVYEEDRQSIEIVYKRVIGIDDKEQKLYDELKRFLESSPEIESIKKSHERKYNYILKSKNILKNLEFFVNKVWNKSIELIERYDLEDRYLLDDEEIYKRIKRIEEIKNSMDLNDDVLINMNSLSIKNIILYGPPGVGKTHNYQNLISMIEENKSQKEIFNTISNSLHVELNNEVFQNIKDENRVEFITFHQSYSYEDFIEGFRPNENGSIKLEAGIFK